MVDLDNYPQLMHGASGKRELTMTFGVRVWLKHILLGSKQKRVVPSESGCVENCCLTSRGPVLRWCVFTSQVYFPAELRLGSLLCSPPARASVGTGTAQQHMDINREDRACSGGVGRRKQGSEQLLQNKRSANAALGRETIWGWMSLLLIVSGKCIPVNLHSGISLWSAPWLLHPFPDALSVIGVM